MACTRPIMGHISGLSLPLKNDCRAAARASSFRSPARFRRSRRRCKALRISWHSWSVRSCWVVISSICIWVSSRSSSGSWPNAAGSTPSFSPTSISVSTQRNGSMMISSNSGFSIKSSLANKVIMSCSTPSAGEADVSATRGKRGNISSKTSSWSRLERACLGFPPVFFRLRAIAARRCCFACCLRVFIFFLLRAIFSLLVTLYLLIIIS